MFIRSSFFYWGSVVNHVHLRHARNASPFQLLQKGSWNKTEQEKSQFPGRRQSTEIHEWRMTCLTWFTFTDNAHCVCYFLWSFFFFPETLTFACLYPVYSLFDELYLVKYCLQYYLSYTEMHCRCNSDNNLNPFSSAPGSIRVTPCGIFCRHAILKCVTTLILNCNTVETTNSFCSFEFCLRQISPSYRWQKQLQVKVPRTRSYVPLMHHMLHASYPITVFWLHKSLLTWRSLIKQCDTYSSKCTWDIKSSKIFSSVLNSMENSVYDLHMTDLMKTIGVSQKIALLTWKPYSTL